MVSSISFFENILQYYYKSVIRFKSKKNTPILTYHSLGELSDNPLISGKIHNISQNLFFEHLNFLKKNYVIVSVDEILHQIKNGKSINGSCAITFDDGYLSNLDQAIPVLDNLQVPATFFIVPGVVESGRFWRDNVRFLINENLVSKFLKYANKYHSHFKNVTERKFYSDTKNPNIISSKIVSNTINKFLLEKKLNSKIFTKKIYLGKEDLQKFNYDNISFGNHSYNHFVLSSLSMEGQYEEISKGIEFLKKINTPISRIFSIPFGGNKDFTHETVEILKDLGYLGFVRSNDIPDALSQNDIDYSKIGILDMNRFMPTKQNFYRLLAQ